MTVNNIFDFLDSLYPVSLALDFDNVGILVGNKNGTVKNCLVALDCTENVIKAAIESKCELIITHHPVIFNPIKDLTDGSIPFMLVNNGISVISMHTNLDQANGGVNDCLCKAIGLKNTDKITSKDGFLLRSGNIKKTTADGFAKQINLCLGGCVKYLDAGKPIEKVLVCSGSGGEFLEDAILGGFDALITADVKHHEFLSAEHHGISVFDAGHFNTEDVVVKELVKVLSEKFVDIKFTEYHTSNIKYV